MAFHDLFKEGWLSICRLSFNLDLACFSHNETGVSCGDGDHRDHVPSDDLVSRAVSHQYDLSLRVQLDRSLMLMGARSLHYEVTGFPFPWAVLSKPTFRSGGSILEMALALSILVQSYSPV